MQVQDLNNLANDLAVLRAEIQQDELELEEIMAKDFRIFDLNARISEAKTKKEQVQFALLEAMKSENLKSWKTEQANFARSTRYSVEIDPVFKKDIEKELRAGGDMAHFKLKTTEFISIRTAA